MLSDHSFVVADVNHPCQPCTPESGFRLVRDWRGVDVDAFADDLRRSELVVSPSDDVVDAFVCYDQTPGLADLNRADFNHYYLGAVIHRRAVDDCTLTTELTKKHTVFELYF